jgi:hypothetical protein
MNYQGMDVLQLKNAGELGKMPNDSRHDSSTQNLTRTALNASRIAQSSIAG